LAVLSQEEEAQVAILVLLPRRVQVVQAVAVREALPQGVLAARQIQAVVVAAVKERLEEMAVQVL
jgi:transcription initiation factor TFIIIB Brf1 subunit/transcription initiation factor TFIIB